MPKRTPKYSLHKPTGQARVRIHGKDFYLGAYGSEESRRRYDELVGQFLQAGFSPSQASLTVSQLCVAYVRHAKSYYVKNGRITSEISAIQQALRPLVKHHGRSRVSEFGPGKLKQVRDRMVEAGIVRRSINRGIGRIRRMFNWGVENELVPASVLAAVNAIAGLKYGRSNAVESPPVRPVPDAHIEAIRELVTSPVWGMIQLQLVTAMRPGEVRLMRLCDIDMSKSPAWEYRPQEHKTEHHGRERVIYIGPKGQEILRNFLKADRKRYLFSPAEGREEFNTAKKEARKSPMTPSQAARTPKAQRKRAPGQCYTVSSYGRAIKKACIAAGIPCWSPNRLRHNAATELRKEHDIETVRTILGHATGFTTEIYAELDRQKAQSVIGRVG